MRTIAMVRQAAAWGFALAFAAVAVAGLLAWLAFEPIPGVR